MSKYISAFRRGDTKQITVSRSGKDSSGSPAPVPFLLGSTLTFSLKSDIDQAEPTLQIVHPVGSGPLDDIEAGICIISLPSTQTSALWPGKYYWDTQLVEDTPWGLATTTLALLQALVNEVIKYEDFIVIEGHIGREAQYKAFREGKSKLRWPQGKHNVMPSNAVDIAPYPLDWNDSLAFARLAGYVQATADSMGIAVRWGGDWDRDGKSKDERFLDLVHFELC